MVTFLENFFCLRSHKESSPFLLVFAKRKANWGDFPGERRESVFWRRGNKKYFSRTSRSSIQVPQKKKKNVVPVTKWVECS